MQRYIVCALLVWAAASPAMAQSYNSGEYGFFHSQDPLDNTGTEFKLSVLSCRPLADAIAMVRKRHGWLVSYVEPQVVFGGDLQQVSGSSGTDFTCPRPIAIEVTYAVADPEEAVASIAEAFNAASGPFQATVGRCGGLLCVTPTTAKDAAGTSTTASTLLDASVTFPAGPKTAGAILAGLEDQLNQVHGTEVTVSGAPPLRTEHESVIVTSDTLTAEPASQVLQRVTSALTQSEWDSKWASDNSFAQHQVLAEQLRRELSALQTEGVRQGMSDAEIEDAWAVKRTMIEAAFTPTTADPAPPFSGFVGPGYAWQALVRYAPGPVGRVEIRMVAVEDPSLRSWMEPLDYTVPVPGIDSDGDGISNDVDLCDGTPDGELVQRNGCTVRQSCPCDGGWANPGAYNACLRDAVDRLVTEGALAGNEKGQYKNTAKEQGCGH